MLTRRPELIPGLLGVGIFIVLAFSEGGFDVTSWAPAGLFLLGLLAIAAYVYRDRLGELEPANRIALLFLAGFVAWNFASIAWADVQGTALATAQPGARLPDRLRPLLGRRLASGHRGVRPRPLFARPRRRRRRRAPRCAGGRRRPCSRSISGRLAEPTGYPNAVAALFVGGFWPAIYLASRRETPWPARGLMLATAGFLIQIALMAQSRGSLIVLPIALLIYLLVVPNRIRAFVALALVAAGVGADGLADPRRLRGQRRRRQRRGRDRRGRQCDPALLLHSPGRGARGGAARSTDRASRERTERAAGRAGSGSRCRGCGRRHRGRRSADRQPGRLGRPALAGLQGRLRRGGLRSSRFSGDLGSGRYDFWRVALDDEFSESPVVGEGADNFAVTYLENRRPARSRSTRTACRFGSWPGQGSSARCCSGVRDRGGRRRVSEQDPGRHPFSRGIAAVALSAMGYFALHSLRRLALDVRRDHDAGLRLDGDRPASRTRGRGRPPDEEQDRRRRRCASRSPRRR